LYSVSTFTRPFVFEVDHVGTGCNGVFSCTGYMVQGVKDLGTGVDVTNFKYGAEPSLSKSIDTHLWQMVYSTTFNNAVLENGVSQCSNCGGSAVTGSGWASYKFEILDAGANYYFSTSAGVSYTLMWNSTSGTGSPLRVGFSDNDQGFSWDNARVRKYASPEPTVVIAPATSIKCGLSGVRDESPYSNEASTVTPAWNSADDVCL